MRVALVLALALLTALGCSGKAESPTGPSPVPTTSRTTVGGAVVESANRPIVGAIIRIIAPAADEGAETTSDAQGLFQLIDIRSTTFVLRVSHPRYQTIEREYTLQRGATVSNLSLALTRLPGVGEFSYVVQEGVDSAELPPIRDAIDKARAYLERVFQWTPTLDVEVLLSASTQAPSIATGGATRITVYTKSAGWISARRTRPKIMLHELFHVLQQQEGWSLRTNWVREGAAEYVAYRGTFIDERSLTETLSRECHASQVVNSTAMQPLEGYATSNGEGNVPVYSLYYLAAERLLGGRDITTFKRVTDFASQFGITEADYYPLFAAYRSELRRPARLDCPQWP